MRKIILLMLFISICIFLFSVDTQNEVQKLTANDAAASQYFGCSSAIDGNWLVMGAKGDTYYGSGSGAAYVYHFENGSWVQHSKLLSDSGNNDDDFGYSVAISGYNIIIGAPGDDDNGYNVGSAYIFNYNGTNWTQTTELHAIDGASSDYYGYCVDISGDYAIIGAYGDDDNGSKSGSAYIYKLENGTWSHDTKLTASNGSAEDNYGLAVCIDDDFVIVGAEREDSRGNNSGLAYIYHLQNGNWLERWTIYGADTWNGENFGIAVDLDNRYAVIGATGQDDNGVDSGCAYVFRYLNEAWYQQDKIVPSDGAEDARFGSSVAISGNSVIVGASMADAQGMMSGAAYLFQLDSGSWIEQKQLLPTDGASMDFAGGAVSISGDIVVVDCQRDDSGSNDAGAGYVFNISGYSVPPTEQQEVVSADDTSEIPFNDVDASLRFTGNHLETTMDLTLNFQEPSVIGGLPAGIVNIADNYWQIDSSAGNVGTYDITFDLSEVVGIDNFATLGFLKRDDESSPWQDVVADLGATLVYNYPYITIQGLNAFSEFVPAGGNDNTLPVTLSSFDAAQTADNNVQLDWSTASETEMNGFNVYRNLINNEADAVLVNSGIIKSNNNASGSVYSVKDYDVDYNNTYYYWLESVSLDGNSDFYGPVSVTISRDKDEDQTEEYNNLGIMGIYPNPFNPETNIDYSVKEETPLEITIYNMKGQKVKTLVDKSVSAGDHKVVWHGDSDSESSVSSGVYFVKMITGNHIETRKIVLMK